MFLENGLKQSSTVQVCMIQDQQSILGTIHWFFYGVDTAACLSVWEAVLKVESPNYISVIKG